jgi:hypothetical protein
MRKQHAVCRVLEASLLVSAKFDQIGYYYLLALEIGC